MCRRRQRHRRAIQPDDAPSRRDYIRTLGGTRCRKTAGDMVRLIGVVRIEERHRFGAFSGGEERANPEGYCRSRHEPTKARDGEREVGGVQPVARIAIGDDIVGGFMRLFRDAVQAAPERLVALVPVGCDARHSHLNNRSAATASRSSCQPTGTTLPRLPQEEAHHLRRGVRAARVGVGSAAACRPTRRAPPLRSSRARRARRGTRAGGSGARRPRRAPRVRRRAPPRSARR